MQFLSDTAKQRPKNSWCDKFLSFFSYPIIKSWKKGGAGTILASGVIFPNFQFWAVLGQKKFEIQKFFFLKFINDLCLIDGQNKKFFSDPPLLI